MKKAFILSLAAVLLLSVSVLAVTMRSEDINKDGVVDMLDLAEVSKRYNAKENDVNYDEKYDINRDGIIDLFDLVLISKQMK